MIKPSPLQVRSAVSVLVLAASTLVGLAVHEGYRDTAYIPVPGDVPTIDFGRTTGVKMGDKSNPVRGLQYLMDEVENVYAAGVKRCVTVPLYPSEYGVYVGFAYNAGVGNFCGSTMVKYLNAGEYGKACGQLVRWIYGPNKVVYEGLQKRRVSDYLECVKDHEGRG